MANLHAGKVRLAQVDDAPAIAEVGARSFRETFTGTTSPENLDLYIQNAFAESQIRAEFADPLVTFHVACDHQEEVVGFLKAHAGPAPVCVTGNRPLELCRLYVLRRQVGQGVGAGLMQACLDHASQHGHDVVWLGVWQHNHRARQFYDRWGFHAVGTHLFVMGSDEQVDDLMARAVPGEG